MPTLIFDAQIKLVAALRSKAQSLGFSDMRVTQASLPESVGERLNHFVEQNFHGDMQWMADTKTRRSSPQAMWSEAKTAIIFAMNYGPDKNPLPKLKHKSNGVISVYALNRDYHDVMKGKLKNLAQWFAAESKSQVKVFVDTAPLMEKPLAAAAGLGWQGKHTNLVSRELGSWFFIGVILTDAELPHDAPEQNHCGTCSACLDICPTQAFVKLNVLDARRCISYLTIEHQGAIPLEFRKAMGNRIYGCDDCLAICPWNKFASAAQEAKLIAREDLKSPTLLFLLGLDDAAFRKFFASSPIKRIGHNRFLRNCLVAAGNSGDRELIPIISEKLHDASAMVREMAVWALSQVCDENELLALRAQWLGIEKNTTVLSEWQLQ